MRTIIYEYCNLGVKSDLLPSIFTDFNSILQNTTYKRTPFTKWFLIFLRQNAKKKNFFEKIDSEENIKNFIANNDNKVIRECI